jgi:hypothetical protein
MFDPNLFQNDFFYQPRGSTLKFNVLMQKLNTSSASKRVCILQAPPNFAFKPPFSEALYSLSKMWAY